MAEQFLIEGDALVRVVGTSHYQDALTAITGRVGDEQVRAEVTATLVPEPENPHDPQAVAVQVGGDVVGYLARDEHPRWHAVIEQLAGHGRVAACEAMIAGRGGDEGGTSNLGVFLRLPTPTEARAQVGARFGRA